MIEEDNILISELKLSDLQTLAETLIKIIKISDGEIKKNTENTLSDVVGFIDKALKKEIITTYQYSQRVFDAFGGKDKALEKVKEYKDKEGKKH